MIDTDHILRSWQIDQLKLISEDGKDNMDDHPGGDNIDDHPEVDLSKAWWAVLISCTDGE